MVRRARLDPFPPRMSKSRVPFLVLLVLEGIPALAVAQPAEASQNGLPEQVELRYIAGPGCPSQAAFVGEVAARIRRPIEWVRESPATLIGVTLGQTDGRATGQLEVV